MWRTIRARIRVWLSCKKNPLLSDPEYRGYAVLEADMRRKHLPVNAVTKAKQERLHQMLAGRA